MRLNWVAGGAILIGLAAAQELPKRELQKKLKDDGVHSSWIYDDIPTAIAAASKSGKPILAVFR